MDRPTPTAGSAAVQRPERRLNTFLVAMAVMWGAYAAMLVILGGGFWWTAFFLAGASGALAKYCGLTDGEDEDEDEGESRKKKRRDRRELEDGEGRDERA
ncbi:hypothetical protein CGZ93_07435 [Enemella dayhoffiae]|uniref:Uncharacterized protein n=2 Tax=Enemella dayhoffiae TaxID=2016507 RepID=A0A255H5U6_9ACTN|nr:hypothetical protein CGZ93_07435 [Enemella dayhoffiae]